MTGKNYSPFKYHLTPVNVRRGLALIYFYHILVKKYLRNKIDRPNFLNVTKFYVNFLPIIQICSGLLKKVDKHNYNSRFFKYFFKVIKNLLSSLKWHVSAIQIKFYAINVSLNIWNENLYIHGRQLLLSQTHLPGRVISFLSAVLSILKQTVYLDD